MLTILLVFGIPVFGFIYMLILAFGSGHSASKRNWARATLIWAVIGAVLGIVFFFVLGMLGYSLSLFAINESAGVG